MKATTVPLAVRVTILLVLLGGVSIVDVLTNPRLSLALAYFFVIFLASRLVGLELSLWIAFISALPRTYGAYLGYPTDESVFVAFWQLFTNISVHLIFAYVIFTQRKVAAFLSPPNMILKQAFSEFAGLREVIFRPYVHSGWGLFERMRAVEEHYQIIAEHVPVLSIAAGEQLEVCRIAAGAHELRAVIDRPYWMRREGEIAISLFSGVDRIYTSMVLLRGRASQYHLVVGSLQGDGRERQSLYKELTHAFHGMRPRDFHVRLLQIIAGEIECLYLLGVSDEAHRSTHWLTKAVKQSLYDEVWKEHGGVIFAGGFYKIHTGLTERPIDDIPSRKRAMYRRRYDLLREVQLQCRTSLGTCPSSATAVA
jgi:uncharacterized protein VirK/YbjX